ncbi:MAG: hypothetical protein RLZZ234_66, partial [Candidatus Parcubacteria bacterium]
MNFGTISLTATLLVALMCGSVSTLPQEAQALFMKPVNPLELIVSPQFPVPNSTITVTLTSYGMQTKDATVTWLINGTQDPALNNQRSITIPTGDGATPLLVEARVSSLRTGTIAVSRTVTTGAVDIIAEPDTSVPFTYEGKPLPTSESPVRLIAVPQLYRQGNIIPKKDILFTWKLNGEILMGGAQRGTDTTTITMPRYGDAEVVVLAETSDGARSAQSRITLSPTKPRVVLYETNSLYGTLPYSPARFTTTKDELSVRAMPFYMPKNVLSQGALRYTWQVGGREVSQGAPNDVFTVARTAGNRQSVDMTYTSTGNHMVIGQSRFGA